jgi:predicted MFS family arabinose efflux permease
MQLGFYDRYTVHHHVRASLGAGMTLGVLLFSEVIARKQLGASRWHVLALLLLPAMAQFVAVAWNPTDPRRPLGPMPFRALGIPSRLLLVALAVAPFLHGPTAFVAVVATSQVAEALLVPVQNTTVARNYGERTRGGAFGRATAANALAIAAVAVPAGYVLNRWPDAWPLLYAGAGAAGAYGYVHWSRLRRRQRVRRAGPPEVVSSPWDVLRRDRLFLAYEACFMVYGLGFMMLQPTLPLYLVDELHVEYSQVGLARGLLFYVAIFVASPILGRWADRAGVLRLGAASFLVLAAFPVVLILAPAPGGLYAGYGVYGLAMAGVSVAWNLGPIVLARGRDPLPYFNAHVALVGIRAVIGMPGGSVLQGHVSTTAVFACVVALEVAAAGGMLLLARAAEERRAAG